MRRKKRKLKVEALKTQQETHRSNRNHLMLILRAYKAMLTMLTLITSSMMKYTILNSHILTTAA